MDIVKALHCVVYVAALDTGECQSTLMQLYDLEIY